MGGEQKLTTMVMKVDLECHKCRKKIKRVLCGIPQIQNQVYDEKANMVIITVLCCSPEKVMDKICCKGGNSVKGIEIVKPKPREAEKPKEKPKPKEEEKPKEKPQPQPQPQVEKPPKEDKPPPQPIKTVTFVEAEKPKQQPDIPPGPKAPPQLITDPPPPPPPADPGIRFCCRECYQGCGVGPCYAMPPGPGYNQQQQYHQGYGRPVYDSWGGGSGSGGGGYYVTRGECFSDDNPASGCVVM